MDFLDPKKQKANAIRIMVGYILIGIALVLAATVLLYQAYGFGLTGSGKVIQNGLAFVSSSPSGADIYVSGKKESNQTNTRLLLSSGQYTVQLKRTGYIDWKRAITVEGGSVERYDYPFLFPSSLHATDVKQYASPQLATQSPDRRWLLLHTSTSNATFEVYDLKNPDTLAKNLQTITLPDTAFTAPSDPTGQIWELEQWSTDNRHVVLKHTFKKDSQLTFEYVLLDRQDSTKSVNLTSTFGVNPARIELRDQAYDHYYLYDEATHAVTTASLKEPAPQPYLTNILAFKSYGSDLISYITPDTKDASKVAVVWQQGSDKYTVRTLPANTTYTLSLTKYSGDWYVAVGDASEGKVYVYKNPIDMLKEQDVTVPVRVLKVPSVDYTAFSTSDRFIMAEHGNQFAVYDAENDKSYAYTLNMPLDSPQLHAVWMDEARITLVSNGKTTVLDFDNANKRTLLPANASYLPFFSTDYKYMYTLSPVNTTGAATLQQIPLRTKADL
jgi:hypothetical protein